MPIGIRIKAIFNGAELWNLLRFVVKGITFFVVVASSAAPPALGEFYNLNYRLSAVDFTSAGDQVDSYVDRLILGSYTNDTAYLNYTNELSPNATENNQFNGGTGGTVSPHGPRRRKGGP